MGQQRKSSRVEQRQRLTIDELRARDSVAYEAFVDFMEGQTMFWALSVGAAGDLRADDLQMNSRVQWIPAIGRWDNVGGIEE